MNIEDIAILCGMDEDVFRQEVENKKSEISKAYRLGKAKIKLEIHRQEIQLAKLASPAAVANTAQYLTDMELKEE